MPLISVLMASYNHEQFVGEAVASVLAQSFGDFELVVVDDASTDNTPGVVAEINDPRISLRRLSVNRERNPRNVGLEHARGELIAIQNSDDVWAENKLQDQVDYL
ncbi:MAG: glycosyltransferase family 2 protein, partial [Alphaproteobacteria bacterium]